MIGTLATTIMAPPAGILASLHPLKPTGFKCRLWHAAASVARRHAMAAAHAAAAAHATAAMRLAAATCACPSTWGRGEAPSSAILARHRWRSLKQQKFQEQK